MTSRPAAVMTGAIAFSDIVGFTELTADHGDDLALAMVERHEALVSAELAPHGRIVKQLGDGLLLFFDDACAAVEAMLNIHRRANAAPTGHTFDDIPCWLRSGLHWGSPRARGTDLIGHDVNLASRISGLAAPGELLATDALLHEIGERREQFTRIGPVFVKGVADPVRVWRAAASPAMNAALRSHN